MLQGEHSAILLTFIKLPFVIKIFVFSIFEWPLKTGFIVLPIINSAEICMYKISEAPINVTNIIGASGVLHTLISTKLIDRRVAEIQIFEKTYLIVIKDETGLKFKMNDSTLFLIGSYAQKLVASY